jgi:hypothetical protein
MLTLVEWLAKFAFDRILGAIVSSAAFAAIVNGALREWTALPSDWRRPIVLHSEGPPRVWSPDFTKVAFVTSAGATIRFTGDGGGDP